MMTETNESEIVLEEKTSAEQHVHTTHGSSCCTRIFSCGGGSTTHPNATTKKKQKKFQTDFDECCEAGTCCFGEFLQSGETIEAQFGPILAQEIEKTVYIPAHSVMEISTTLELGDSVAWAFQVLPSGCLSRGSGRLRFSCYWFDLSENKSVNPDEDAFGVGEFWPAKPVSASDPPCTGSFTVDGENCKRASLIMCLDNRSSTTEKKTIRLTMQQRGFHPDMHINTPYGKGTITGWTGTSIVVDLKFGVGYFPPQSVLIGNDIGLKHDGSPPKHSCFVMRTSPGFRFQHIHKPFKYFPSLESMGINVIAGNFSREENAHEKLWGKLTDAEKDTLRQAFEGFDVQRLVDYHVHIVGSGQSGSGCYITPKMTDPFRAPFGYVKLKAFMSASGIGLINSDEEYEKRLITLARHVGVIPALLQGKSEEQVQQMDRENKLVCLAFDKSYDESGVVRMDKTTLHIPNDYSFDFTSRHLGNCVGTCSVHPYRHDCDVELERCFRRGIRLIKWLPNSMLIDPLSEKCDKFYRKVAELGMILLSHTGEEHSVSSAALVNEYGNPLRLRRALDHGVKVIAAHMATEGTAIDLDKVDAACNPRFPPRELNFNLLMRLFHEEKYKDLLFADFSAIIAIKRAGYVNRILDATEIHSRIVYGSDYPVPCLNFGVVTRQLQVYGLINAQQRRVLQKIYKYNPLFFDLACKRFLKSKKGNKFPDHVFYEHPLLSVTQPFQTYVLSTKQQEAVKPQAKNNNIEDNLLEQKEQ